MVSRAWLCSIGKEKLLALDPAIPDGLLPFDTDQPVDESLPLRSLDVRMPGRVYKNHAVLVEQVAVTFHHDLQITPVFEADPRCAIRQNISLMAVDVLSVAPMP
jgi:hypothetical protein